MSNIWQEDIDDLMEAFGQTVRGSPDSPPVTSKEIELRVSLIKEEAKELTDALEGGDFVGAADGIVDLLVVTFGTASCLGINVGPLWDLVYINNMSKVGGPKDPETGKQLKPEGWEPPDIEGELKKQGWLFDDGTPE
jgi:predicted HAD superfamily Cof-like phosphohydrolase